MRSVRMVLILGFLLTTGNAQAGHWAIGVRVGFPFIPAPCYGPVYGYYRPAPVYVVAPPPVPVIVQPAAVVAAPPSAGVAPVPPPPGAPCSTPTTTQSASMGQPVARGSRPDEANDLSELNSADEQIRARAAVEAGRNKDRRAVARLTQLLNRDSSPQVRDAAARGLGLIADPSGLAALQRAAQADDDRDVRRSAAFAADVIRANMPRY